MREASDMGARALVALLAGAGLVALLGLAAVGLPPSGALDAMGGWPLLTMLAALLCGVGALGMSLGLRWPSPRAARLVTTGLLASALVWGACLSAAATATNWASALAGAPELGMALAPLGAVGASLIAWLLVIAGLAGLAAGLRDEEVSPTARALTPLWLTPLWSAGVGAVYGLLFALVFRAPVCPPGYRCFGLDVTRWDGLRVGLPLGAGSGLALGLILALALRLALIVRPSPAARAGSLVGEALGARRSGM